MCRGKNYQTAKEAMLHGSDKRIEFVLKAEQSRRVHRFTRVYEGVVNPAAAPLCRDGQRDYREELEILREPRFVSDVLGRASQQKKRERLR